MRYAASWDRSLRVSTGALLALLAVIAVVLVAITSRAGGALSGALGALAVAVVAAIAGFARALAPTGYAVTAGTLRVERRLSPLAFPLSGVTAVARLPRLPARGTARLGGSSGFFGHYGRFWNRSLGSFRLYATRMTDLVLLDLPGERILVSPDAPDRFLEEVLAAAPRAARVAEPAALGRRPLPRRAKLELAALVVAVPLVVCAILGAAFADAPVGVEVRGGAVRVERRLAPPVEIPLASVRDVERLGACGGFRRVAGFQGPGSAYGRFRSEALGEFQLYDWGGGAYVLLRTDGGQIVLTPDDPEGFVAAVRAGRAGR